MHGGGGCCQPVCRAVAAARPGWHVRYGTLHDDDGTPICTQHAWCETPDGTVVDLTYDQFGMGDDIRVVAAGDAEHGRWRPMLRGGKPVEGDPLDESGRHEYCDGLVSQECSRLIAERGRNWWVTDPDGHAEWHRQQSRYEQQFFVRRGLWPYALDPVFASDAPDTPAFGWQDGSTVSGSVVADVWDGWDGTDRLPDTLAGEDAVCEELWAADLVGDHESDEDWAESSDFPYDYDEFDALRSLVARGEPVRPVVVVEHPDGRHEVVCGRVAAVAAAVEGEDVPAFVFRR